MLRTKRKRLIVVGAFTVIAVIGIVVNAFHRREPFYQGKSLSAWLVEVNHGVFPRQSGVSAPADEAIRQIGTNAFPKICELLRSRDSAAKAQLILFLNRHSLFGLHISSQVERQRQAIAACYVLGPTATPLVPEVAKALPDMKWGQSFAAQWLSSLGPGAEAAIPALVAIMKDKTNSQRVMVAQPLANIAIYRPQDVLPVLNECLKDTNTAVRLQATAALKILKRDADRAALVKTGAQ